MSTPQDDAPEPPRWATPGTAGGAPAPVTPVPPPAPVSPGYGPSPVGHAPVGYGPAPVAQGTGYGPGAWTPPPLQPGIIPLRPLSLGEILDGAFRAVRANPAVMFGLAALVVTVAVLLGTLLQYVANGVLAATVDGLTADADPGGVVTEQLNASLTLVFVSLVVAVATPVLTGLVIVSVSRSVLGRTISFREALRQRRAWLVLAFTLLLGLVETLVLALLVGAVVLLVQADLDAVAALVGLGGALLLLVGLVLVTVRTLLVPPALMLEGGRFWASVGRAWRLSRGSFWRLLGIYLLVQILVGVVQQAIITPFSLVAGVLSVNVGTGLYLAVVSVGTVIATTLSTTYLSSVLALLYVDTRMRREGLDIELARAAAAGPTDG